MNLMKANALTCNADVVQRCIFRIAWVTLPLSILAPGTGSLIETKGSTSVFTAVSYIRAGNLLSKLSRKEMERSIAVHKTHVREEGENLKAILER